jgi:hypothetical protein
VLRVPSAVPSLEAVDHPQHVISPLYRGRRLLLQRWAVWMGVVMTEIGAVTYIREMIQTRTRETRHATVGEGTESKQ